MYFDFLTNEAPVNPFKDAETLWNTACGYFKWCDENPIILSKDKARVHTRTEGDNSSLEKESNKKMRPYTLSGLCLYMGISVKEWGSFKNQCSRDFAVIVKRVESVIETQNTEGEMIGEFKRVFGRQKGI